VTHDLEAEGIRVGARLVVPRAGVRDREREMAAGDPAGASTARIAARCGVTSSTCATTVSRDSGTPVTSNVCTDPNPRRQAPTASPRGCRR
jgi:hypothetical protein